MIQVKTWFQNRRAKWRRLKQDSQDGEKENSNNRGMKSDSLTKDDRTDDENTSAEEECANENTDTQQHVNLDSQKITECKPDQQSDFAIDKLSNISDPYSASLIGESSFNGLPVGKETENVNFQPQNFSVTTPTSQYSRNSTINPLGSSYFPTQVMHQTYQPPSFHPAQDYQPPIFSSHLSQPLPTISSSTQFDAYVSNLNSGNNLPTSSLLSIESTTE